MISAIALDLGSTSIKAGLLDQHGLLTHIVALPVPPVIADNGRYESNALLYAEIADQVLSECLSQAGTLPPLGLCCQRSSFLLWEQATGIPVTPLISWQDNRGADSCSALQAQEPLITGLTGLRLTPYFFAGKLRVLLRENPQWLARLQQGELLAGTLDTFMIWRWTEGRQFITDASMAARTLLMDIRQQGWSPRLCDLFGIPLNILPAIHPSAGLKMNLRNGLTLQASLGDQSAALLASVGEDREVALVNLGTGGFVIRYLAEDQAGIDGYLRTLVFQDSMRQTHFSIEGTLNSIAAALEGYPVADCTLADLASNDIYCLAEPSGIGAPYFRKDIGLRFSAPVEHLSQKEHACLLLEGIIFRVAQMLEDFHSLSRLKQVYLSGGLSELICLQQGIAQCVQMEVVKLQQKEASLQGAAMLAGGVRHLSCNDLKDTVPVKKNGALINKYFHWKQWLEGIVRALP